MITAKNLKRMLAKEPDDARIHAYEGEDVGLEIIMPDGSFEWIRATESKDEDEQNEFTLNSRIATEEYMILLDGNPSRLQKKVNEEIKNGWEPIGGIDSNVLDDGIEYLQAMICKE